MCTSSRPRRSGGTGPPILTLIFSRTVSFVRQTLYALEKGSRLPLHGGLVGPRTLVVGLEKRKTSTVPGNEPRFLVCTARILNYPWPQQFCTTTITSLTLSQIKVPYGSLWKLQSGRNAYSSAREQVKRKMSAFANR